MQKPNDIEVADSILARYTEPNGAEAYIRAAKLLIFARRIVWRNAVTTQTGAARVWKQLESELFDREWIVEMVTEYVYLLGMTQLRTQIAPRQAEAMAWVKDSMGVPTEMAKLSSTESDMSQGLAKNPLLMFLYSLSLGMYNKRLADVGIERLMAGGKVPKNG
jgi:hypothetical protein